MSQFGFFIDTSRCTGCNACVIACKQWRNIPPGPAKPIRVFQWEKGVFPAPDVRVLPLMCFHCKEPRCLSACGNKAIYKEEKYGAVLVDHGKCRGDRKCFDACPYGTPQFLSDAGDEKMLKCDMCIERLDEGAAPLCVLSCSLRALDFGPIDVMREKYGDSGSYIGENAPPCRNACPGGIDVQQYMNLAAEEKNEEAIGVCLESTPFIGVLGRVCTRPCEIDCFLGRFDDSAAIREIKRYLSDHVKERRLPPGIANTKKTGKRVAVVGGGPAGLSCAYQSALKGHHVTVFESEEEMGGMMRYGIPEYRLPRGVLNSEIGVIRDLGVEMINGQMVGDLGELTDYDAVFLATGSGEGIPLRVPGADLGGIETAVEFLHKVNTAGIDRVDEAVVVVGGGSVAVDTARSALRLGAPEVHIVCLESADYKDKEHMPAQEDEVLEAIEEGIIIHDKMGVHSFNGDNGKVTGAVCVSCLCVRDAEGSFSPQYAEAYLDAGYSCACYVGGGALPVIPAGRVYLALGQRSPASAYPAGTPRNASGRVGQARYLQTTDPRIFAGGDILTGTVDIISAVAAGNEAAESIHRYLEGGAIPDDRRVIPSSAKQRVEKKSAACGHRPADLRRSDFCEISLGFSADDFQEQSGRCLHCGTMQPSAVIRRETPKRVIVPWDPREALTLWSKRHPEDGEALPDVISDIEEVLDPDEAPVFCRGKLNLKARTSREKLLNTMDDE